MRTGQDRAAARGGFTLLEVTLSMAIGVVLLGALYAALNFHLQNADAGREVVEHSTLARAMLARMTNDIGGALNLDDAARYRYQNGSGAGGGGGGGGAAPSGGATPATGAAGATGATGGTGTTGTTSSTTSGLTTSVTLPLGLQGNSTSLTVLVSRTPTEVWAVNPDGGANLTSDLRLISYWFVQGKGLYRQEIKAVTSADAAALLPPNGTPPDDATLVMAAEVGSLQFRYWDGTEWSTDWDGTTLGADGVTPIGPPRLVEITLGLIPTRRDGASDDQQDLEMYRHVVGIVGANGDPAPTSTASGSGATP
jgi:prepilin-type N-terminal cleavage/methylation domain-containing protein